MKLPPAFRRRLDFAADSVGFDSFREFFFSLIGGKLLLKSSIMGFALTFSLIGMWVESAIGVPWQTFLGFIVLNLIEWWTGVRGALTQGETFESLKAQRAIFKTFVYVVVLASLNSYRLVLVGGGPFWWAIDSFFWLILSGVTLVLARSIIENLHKMNVREAEVVYLMLSQSKLKSIAFLFAPPSQEKQNRSANK